jgi:aminoglycoside phosphotransferase (APT) family kinase protein
MAATPVDTRLLAAALADQLGEVNVQATTRLSGGASRETWAFDAVAADGSVTELVLRRDPPGRPSEPGAMGREARAISAARAAGLAVPDVLVADNEPGLLGSAGLVMRRVPGETIARRILRDDRYERARHALVGQVAGFAAGLHGLPVPDGLPEPDPLADLRARLDELGAASQDQPGQIQPSEVFERAFDALERNRPPRREPVMVHGDLRLGNLIVDQSGLAAVIDWELVHAGQPAEDLGWMCVRAWRFGGAGPAAGLASREQLLAAYSAAGGADISADELRWWETLGTLRWGVICMAQAWVHLSGAYRSVELAAIGRRVCEQEWDLLTLLEPEAAARAAARRPRPSADPRPSPAPHGRPTASELLDAVRGYLNDQVMPGTSGQLAFHARVAANVLAIVARELDLGPLPASGEEGADLADKVAARLAVANPRYFD